MRHPSRATLLATALAAGAALAPAPCLARPIPAPAPPVGPLRPGTVVETVLPALGRDLEECELLLLPEGGAPIRVSAETGAGARTVRWRVPATTVRRARLVLRAGGEGREWESAPSAAFELAPPGADEAARLQRGASEAGHRLEPLVGVAPAGWRAAPGAPALVAGRGLAAPSEAPAAPEVARAPASRLAPPGTPTARPAVLELRPCRAPRFVPLRN